MEYLCSFSAVGMPLRLPHSQDATKTQTMPIVEPQVAVQQIPGKGRGLVAKDWIRKGQLIIEEVPVCQKPSLPSQHKLQRQASLGCGIPSALWDSAASDFFDEIITGKVVEETGRQRRPQQKRRGGEPFFRLPEAGESSSSREQSPLKTADAVSALSSTFPLISCINHSCLPNAHASWHPVQRKEVVYALKDIHPGEEITTTYVSLDADSSIRNKQLFDRFGFYCRCTACSLPADKRLRSDARRRKMASLDRRIPGLAESQPERAVRYAEELVRLVDKEGILDTSIKARAFYDAFQICLSYPLVGDAKHYATLAFENYLTCRGPDSPCTLRLYGYMLNPESHPASKTARQYADAVRKGIENERVRHSRRRRHRDKRHDGDKEGARDVGTAHRQLATLGSLQATAVAEEAAAAAVDEFGGGGGCGGSVLSTFDSILDSHRSCALEEYFPGGSTLETTPELWQSLAEADQPPEDNPLKNLWSVAWKGQSLFPQKAEHRAHEDSDPPPLEKPAADKHSRLKSALHRFVPEKAISASLQISKRFKAFSAKNPSPGAESATRAVPTEILASPVASWASERPLTTPPVLNPSEKALVDDEDAGLLEKLEQSDSASLEMRPEAPKPALINAKLRGSVKLIKKLWRK